MKAVLAVILLFTTCCCSFGSCERLTECCQSCVSKVPDKQLCNKTCVQLFNSPSASNSATLAPIPPVPDAPILLSSGYFTFTLDWRSYSQTYNGTPVVYVLEVTRHVNITDPFIMLPYIQKYHTTTNTTFTIPEEFVTKANFSFRLAAVTLQGTSNFSPSSLLYRTNSSCPRLQHLTNQSRFFPCPVFNVRLNFTVTPVQFEKPRFSTILSWDFPPDLHGNLEEGILSVTVGVSSKIHPDRLTDCLNSFGLASDDHDTFPVHPATSHVLKLSSNKQFYFGCTYDVKLFTYYNFEYETLAIFDIPQCIHGVCGCGREPRVNYKESDHILIDVRDNNITINRTTVHVTWTTAAWQKKPAYFRIILLECIPTCPSSPSHRAGDIVPADLHGARNTYNVSYANMTKGREYRFYINAFDISGCKLTPTARKSFFAVIPTAAPTTVPTKVPTTVPSTDPTTISSTAATTGSTGVVASTAEQGMSSATVAAITVPIFLLVIIGLLLAMFWYCRVHRKPLRLHREPTGLQRLADHLDDWGNNRRNVGDLPSSPYANDYNRMNLVVNLPSKSEGGLELNPAYVEQRIQEAVEIGEADEFEFGFHRLELKRVLGKGAFGKVFLAEAYGMGGSEDTTLVAVKVLNDKASEDEIEDFKMEINFMKTIGRHENVVTMLGCCTLYPPLCLVVEYVPHGDLLHYLRDLRKTFEQQYRKLQGDDIKSFEKEEKSSTSQAATDPSESTFTGSVSHRPLIPSASDTKQYEKSHDSSEKPTFKRSTSLKSLKALSVLNTARRASEVPQVHYVKRGPTDTSNDTETTLVLDSKNTSKIQAASPTRAMSLDGALDSSDLQSFAFQIANGMAYLSGTGVVHRDLAARNILVGDEKVLKISDFGLSREGVYVKRSTGKIPLRWLSIEAMRDRIYSTSSDVWAFGIVLWEICTLGGFPYPTINDRDLLDFLQEGDRMEKPSNCTDEIYQLMLACWSRECEDRPSFQTLSEQLFDMLKEEQPYVNVDPSQDFTLPPAAGQDTVGNLIAFSDGTFSGDTADHLLAQRDLSSNQSTPSKVSQQNELPHSGDEENAGYESSDESENFVVSFGDTAGNLEVDLQSPARERPAAVDDINSESPV